MQEQTFTTVWRHKTPDVAKNLKPTRTTNKKTGRVEVTINGVTYRSKAEATFRTKFTVTRINTEIRRAGSNTITLGPTPPAGGRPRVQLVIDGVKYDGFKKAAEGTKLTRHAISKLISVKKSTVFSAKDAVGLYKNPDRIAEAGKYSNKK